MALTLGILGPIRPYLVSYSRQVATRSFTTSLLLQKSKLGDSTQTKNDDNIDKDNKQENDKKSNKLPITREIIEKVQPYLDTTKHYYSETSKKVDSIVVPLKFHINKAREAIKDANAKLELQEKESENYGFKEDFTKSDDAKVQGKKQTIEGLPSDRERHRKKWAKKLEFYIDSLQETIFTATRALNDVTGYSAIQKLRSSIEALEMELQKSKANFQQSKDAHLLAVTTRQETQSKVNDLLKRKASWDDNDLENFTRLYKQDHENALLEEQTKDDMERAERLEEELQDKLSKAILTRYHEEQIWSDKIRRTSTWGTFGLMGINILLFLVFQLALEPWKRRRLVGNFEERVHQALEANSIQQNARLDIMSQKVEALKNSDRLPILQERHESEIDEEEAEIIEPPKVRQLPLPPSPDLSWQHMLRHWCEWIIQPFATPWDLLFKEHYQSATLQKNELLSMTTLSITFGVLLGTLMTHLLR